MSFLKHFGNVLKQILGIATELAVIAEPIVMVAVPGVGPLYASAVGLALGAEAMAPTLAGTGPQKLSQLTASLTPQILKWAAENGIVWPEAEIKAWASAVVDTLNKIPAPTVAPVKPV